jgi:plasmid rolling circle replication initiator protein Rep
MSDAPGRGHSASSLSLQDREAQHHTNVPPALCDLSEKDKPWDVHKSNADKVAKHYLGSDYQRYAERVQVCADLLEFKLAPDQFEGAYKLKLASARFCHLRHCPICQWRRSLMWKAKAYKILPQVVADYEKHRWLFVTLTQRNVPITELRKTLTQMNKAFTRLTQLKSWPGKGWIKSTEVTRGRDGDAHPHFHVLMMVNPSYFKTGYLSQKRWCELWQKCLRIDYQPVLDVQAVKPTLSPTALLAEVIKYQVKESDLIADRAWFLELTSQLHRTKAVSVGGVLRDYLRELEQDPEDLIGESDDPDAVEEGSLYFGWRCQEKRYRMID